MTISIEELHSLFDLDADRGLLLWKKAGGGRKAGAIAGAMKRDGYRQLSLKCRRAQVHRAIFAMTHGRWPTLQIDHINGDRSDNRPCNLREATASENQRNTGRNPRNTSGYKGVCWNKSLRKWQASIRTGSGAPKMHLGIYDDPELAALVYQEAARKFHGQFARIAG